MVGREELLRYWIQIMDSGTVNNIAVIQQIRVVINCYIRLILRFIKTYIVRNEIISYN